MWDKSKLRVVMKNEPTPLYIPYASVFHSLHSTHCIFPLLCVRLIALTDQLARVIAVTKTPVCYPHAQSKCPSVCVRSLCSAQILCAQKISAIQKVALTKLCEKHYVRETQLCLCARECWASVHVVRKTLFCVCVVLVARSSVHCCGCCDENTRLQWTTDTVQEVRWYKSSVRIGLCYHLQI